MFAFQRSYITISSVCVKALWWVNKEVETIESKELVKIYCFLHYAAFRGIGEYSTQAMIDQSLMGAQWCLTDICKKSYEMGSSTLHTHELITDSSFTRLN
jgi:hypothetical protein